MPDYSRYFQFMSNPELYKKPNAGLSMIQGVMNGLSLSRQIKESEAQSTRNKRIKKDTEDADKTDAILSDNKLTHAEKVMQLQQQGNVGRRAAGNLEQLQMQRKRANLDQKRYELREKEYERRTQLLNQASQTKGSKWEFQQAAPDIMSNLMIGEGEGAVAFKDLEWADPDNDKFAYQAMVYSRAKALQAQSKGLGLDEAVAKAHEEYKGALVQDASWKEEWFGDVTDALGIDRDFYDKLYTVDYNKLKTTDLPAEVSTTPGQPGAVVAPPTTPQGISEEEWAAMTPEEQSLFTGQ